MANTVKFKHKGYTVSATYTQEAKNHVWSMRTIGYRGTLLPWKGCDGWCQERARLIDLHYRQQVTQISKEQLLERAKAEVRAKIDAHIQRRHTSR